MNAMVTHAPPRPPIDCRDAVRQLWDYLDGELDADRYADIAAHVEQCRSCGEHYAFARRFLAALGAPPASSPGAMRAPSAPSDATSQELRARVIAALQRDGFPTPPD